MVQTREELLIRAVVEDKASQGLDKIVRKLDETGREAVNTSQDFDRVDRSLVDLENTGSRGIRKIDGDIRGLGITAASVGRQFVGLGAGISAVFALRQGVGDAIEFSRAIAEVSTISDATNTQLQRLEGQVLDLASAHGQSAVAITRGLYQTISAGVTDADDALKVLTASQELATAGLASTAETVDLLTSTINAYGLSIEEAAGISDVFFTGVRVGKTTVGELAGSLGQVLPIAASLKVPLEDIVGLVAAITARGVSTSEAVTQIRAALVALLKNGEDVNEVLANVGETFDDTTLRTRGLVDVLQSIRDAVGGSESALTQLFGRVEATNAILNVTGDNLEGVRATLDAVRDSAGATGDALEKIQRADGSRALRFFNQVRQGFLQLGSEVIEFPFLVADSVAGAVDELGVALSGLSNFELPAVVPTQIQEARQEAERLADELGLLQELRDRERAFNERTSASLPTGESRARQALGPLVGQDPNRGAAGFDLVGVTVPDPFRSGELRQTVEVSFLAAEGDGFVRRILEEPERIRIRVPVEFTEEDLRPVIERAAELSRTFRGTAQEFGDALTAQLEGNRFGIEIDGQVEPIVRDLDNGLQRVVTGFTTSLEDGILRLIPVVREEVSAAGAAQVDRAFESQRSRQVTQITVGSQGLFFQDVTAQSEAAAKAIERANEEVLAGFEAAESKSAQAIEALADQALDGYERRKRAVEELTASIEAQIGREVQAGEISAEIARNRQEEARQLRDLILEQLQAREREQQQRGQPAAFDPIPATVVQEIEPGRFAFGETAVSSQEDLERVRELNEALLETIERREALEGLGRDLIDPEAGSAAAQIRREADKQRRDVAEQAGAGEISVQEATALQEAIDAREREALLLDQIRRGEEEALSALEARSAALRVEESLRLELEDGYARELALLEERIERERESLLEQARRGELDAKTVENLVNEGGLLDAILLKEKERLELLQEQAEAVEKRERALDSEDSGAGLVVGIQDNVRGFNDGRVGARAGDALFRGVSDSIADFSNALVRGENALEAFGSTIADVIQQILIQAAAETATRAIFGGFGFARGGEVPNPSYIGGGVLGFARGGLVPDADPADARQVRYFAGGGFGSFARDPRDTIPALLRPNEFVLRPEAVRSAPSGALDRLNSSSDFAAFAREMGGAALSSAPSAQPTAINQRVSLGGMTFNFASEGPASSANARKNLVREVEAAIERGIRGANAGLVNAVRQAAGRRPS